MGLEVLENKMTTRVRQLYNALQHAEDLVEKLEKELEDACREMELRQPLWGIHQDKGATLHNVRIYTDMNAALEQLRKTEGKRVSLDGGKTFYRLGFGRVYVILAQQVSDIDEPLEFIIEEDHLDKQQNQ